MPTNGDDVINDGDEGTLIDALAGDDSVNGNGGNDIIIGGPGDDTLNGGPGNDEFRYRIGDGADQVTGGPNIDVVQITRSNTGQVRLTFTSADVGDGQVLDGANAANEDGGLAVRLQAENNAGGLVGDVARFDDEGMVFISINGSIDVRDLPSGVSRGVFKSVALGTPGADVTPGSDVDDYLNGGGGNDTASGGAGNDFLVGGAGDDQADGGTGNDTFIGGAGNDVIAGGAGEDVAIFDVVTGGADQVDLGANDDTVNVSGAGVSQVRLTFTSADVGNGNALDGANAANEDGGLAVRLQAEDGSGALVGGVSRYDDEGITFKAAAGMTFDVRDLPSGAARGDVFTSVTLGSSAGETLGGGAGASSDRFYVNGGAGDDRIIGGEQTDFLVGGAGDDTLIAGIGADTLFGGAGSDALLGGSGADSFFGGAGGDSLRAGANDGAVDVFLYAALSDSTVLNNGGRDGIAEFEAGIDKVDISAFGVTAAQLRFIYSGGNTLLRLDGDGDGQFDDFGLAFTAATVTAADFIL